MKCTYLAERIQQLCPEASTREVAHLCLLLCNSNRKLDDFNDDSVLTDAWQEIDLRMRAVTDQHAAMTEDLERLQLSNAPGFTAHQIWQLVRTFNVQSQLLRLYLSAPSGNRST